MTIIGYWLVIVIILLLLVNALREKNNVPKYPTNKFRNYLKEIFSIVVLVAILSMFNLDLWAEPDFDTMGRGLMFEGIGIVGISVTLYSLLLSCTKWTPYYPKDKKMVPLMTDLFGIPVAKLPDTMRTFWVFTGTIILAVILEEILFRLFLFNALFHLFGIGGDVLVLISSLLFALLHSNYNWKGMLQMFIFGNFLGKVYLIEGSLMYPIVIHLIHNLVVCVLAFRRIVDLRTLGEPAENESD